MITVVNVLGVMLIAVVVWWFWLWKPKAAVKANKAAIEVIVDNGVYEPAVIEGKVGTTITLRFLRKDASPCSSTVVFDDFGVSAELPKNTPTPIVLTLTNPGEFTFTCQMGMYRGRLIVLE